MTDSQQMEFPGLTASQRASRVPTSASPDVRKASTVRFPAYGETSPAFVAKFDPTSYCWKTSQTLLPDLPDNPDNGSDVFCQTWPRSGLMRSGIAYQLRPLAHRTTATESGLLPTLRAANAVQGAHLNRKQHGDDLPTAIARRILPTLSAGDHRSGKGFNPNSRKNSPQLRHIINGTLNPNWADWFMGYPIGYSELKR